MPTRYAYADRRRSTSRHRLLRAYAARPSDMLGSINEVVSLRRPPFHRPDPDHQCAHHQGPQRLLSLPIARSAGRGGEGHPTTLEQKVRPALPSLLSF